jgi:hypothetical protein
MSQFSDTSTYTGICEEIDFFLNTDSTSYPLVQKARNVNHWYDRVVNLIMQCDNRWEWDDHNQTDLPIATTALVSGQQDYAMDPTIHFKILRVEILDSNGEATQLTPMTQSDKVGTALTEYESTNGVPLEYDLVGNSIFLYPAPNYAKTSGLKIYFQRGASYFVSTDTTKKPGFNAMFHRILSYGAAYDYSLSKGDYDRINLFREEIKELENGLIKFYSQRDRDTKYSMTVSGEDYGQESDGFVSENRVE